MHEAQPKNLNRESAHNFGTRWTFGKVIRALDLECVVCICVTLLAVCLHVTRLFNAGALWRDEAGLVALATLPTLGEVWQMLTYDSFPLLFPLLVRLWVELGFGNSDFGLRMLGLMIGLGMLGVLWWVAWVLGKRKPLVSLGLLAINATVIQWGDSIRAYGLGAMLMLTTLGLIWQTVVKATPTRFIAATVFGLASVQCLYQNAFLLCAICCSAAVVCLRHRRFKNALLSIAAGLPAALSLLPYLQPLKKSQSWWIVGKAGFRPPVAWASFSEAFGTPPWLGPLIWIGLFVLAVWTGVASLEKPISRRDEISVELPLFVGLTALTGAFGFFLFLWHAGLPTQPWYWLPLMPIVAVCVQTGLSDQVARHRLNWALAVGLFVVISLLPAWSRVTQRQTNIDFVAHILNERVKDEDLVVVLPWYCGISFKRYYNGPAQWTTIPPIADHRFHRYDLLKEKLAAPDPNGPVLERMRHTLRAGNKVWVVGLLPKPRPGEITVPTLPPAPHGPLRWFDEPYNYVWGRQIRHFIENTATQLEQIVTLENTKGVSRSEKIELLMVSGYRFGTFPAAGATGF